jgi:protease-4
MKAFFKTVLATMIGLFLFFAVGLLFFAIIAAAGGSDDKATLASKSVLHLKFDDAVAEREPEDNPFEKIFNDGAGTDGLRDIIAAIKEAKTNENV